MSPRTSTSTLRDFAEKLPFLHPQPTPRQSRDYSRQSRDYSRNSYDLSPRRTSLGLPSPISARHNDRHERGPRSRFSLGTAGKRHRRQLSLSSFSPRGVGYLVILLFVVLVAGALVVRRWSGGDEVRDDGGVIPLGQSRMRDGREVFWWEQFERLNGYYRGRKEVVGIQDWVSEQEGKTGGVGESENLGVTATETLRGRENESPLVDVTANQGFVPCYIDEKRGILPPKLSAYSGLPQGFPTPLFGSHSEVRLRADVCYDRVNRFAPYGFGFTEEEGGLGLQMEGDSEGRDAVQGIDYRDVNWGRVQDKCTKSQKYAGPRNAFVIRTWYGFEYTPYHIMMLRAIISELTLTTGGRYTVHFLIHVQDDTIPIWSTDDMYNQVLNVSLPAEFAGMGTLWSVAQMKLIYPPPFPDSLENFSGDDIYKAYRSLHFPLQYFAQKHPEFEHFWEWEMDIRVTGSYLELLEQVTKWAERQEQGFAWEKSAQFFVPQLFEGSFEAYEKNVQDEVHASGRESIMGPQLLETERVSIPGVTNTTNSDVDLITFSPLFDPQNTRWAFHNDLTGYPRESRPPTRAALITASRLSRRLLLTMHHETFSKKHTMFPEMFPASIALHYGYKAVYAPLPVYFDRDWPAKHADHVFNNAVINDEERRAGMDHGSGHFHGQGGSVFGPGEHVFRGASWYSNAGFAGYLWRRWLGRENGNGEIAWESDPNRGRMCLPMMVLHPVKNE